jgi:large subunit ribosomal protein L13
MMASAIQGQIAFDRASLAAIECAPFRGLLHIEFLGIVVMKTFSAKTQEVQHDWLLVDAADQVLGRLAAQIASRLRGKHKAIYTPHVDTGEFVVVVNAEKLRVTGNKAEAKLYHRHTTYPGGLYTTNFAKMQARHPGRALEKAVKGMLPKGPLGYAMLRKMKVYAGGAHPHEAQQPKLVNLLKTR